MNPSNKITKGFEPGFVSDNFQPEQYRLPVELEGKGHAPLRFTPDLEDAFRRHRKAMYVLTEKDRPIPSIEEMERDLEEPNNGAYWKKQIEKARKEHEEDLERMYRYHAEQWYQDHVDQCRTFSPDVEEKALELEDGSKIDIEGDDNEKPKEKVAISRRYLNILASMYMEDTNPYRTQQYLQFADNFESLRYSHLAHLLNLETRQQKLMVEEEQARKAREAQFPQTPAEFYAKEREAQMRVARFLKLDGEGPSGKLRQEKMMSEFGWAWRQVEPLLEDFKSDPAFKANVMAKLLEISTSDPRKVKA